MAAPEAHGCFPPPSQSRQKVRGRRTTRGRQHRPAAFHCGPAAAKGVGRQRSRTAASTVSSIMAAPSAPQGNHGSKPWCQWGAHPLGIGGDGGGCGDRQRGHGARVGDVDLRVGRDVGDRSGIRRRGQQQCAVEVIDTQCHRPADQTPALIQRGQHDAVQRPRSVGELLHVLLSHQMLLRSPSANSRRKISVQTSD